MQSPATRVTHGTGPIRTVTTPSTRRCPPIRKSVKSPKMATSAPFRPRSASSWTATRVSPLNSCPVSCDLTSSFSGRRHRPGVDRDPNVCPGKHGQPVWWVPLRGSPLPGLHPDVWLWRLQHCVTPSGLPPVRFICWPPLRIPTFRLPHLILLNRYRIRRQRNAILYNTKQCNSILDSLPDFRKIEIFTSSWPPSWSSIIFCFVYRLSIIDCYASHSNQVNVVYWSGVLSNQTKKM